MTVDRDTTRKVRSWLQADRHESADRVLKAVLDVVDTTRQRRATRWPTWAFPRTIDVRRLGVASALVAVASLVALNVVSPSPGPGVVPSRSPAPTSSAAASVVEASPVVYPSPEVIIPPGVATTRTAEEVAQMMLAEIATNERAVGRALAPPRIIRIQLLGPRDIYYVRYLSDGRIGLDATPRRGAPSWVVDAVGTFIDPIGRDGGLATSIGTHGYYMWGDDGLGAYEWFPCWVRTSDEYGSGNMEGQCGPPSAGPSFPQRPELEPALTPLSNPALDVHAWSKQ